MELNEILAERIRLWSQVKLTDLDLWWRMSVDQKIKIARLEAQLERLRKLGRESDSHRKTEMSVRGDHEGQLSWAIHWAKPMLDALLADEEGFFCQKCGTVYTEIMACRTCQPKAYKKLAEELLDGTE